MKIPGFMIDLRTRDEQWSDAVNNLIERLNKEGYISIANWGLALDVIDALKIAEANVFLIVEGIEEHIIINKKGAESVKKNLIKDQTYIIKENKHNRILMNEVALKQVEVLIDMFASFERK